MKKLGEKVLWRRAKDYVARYEPDIVGVTGSFGKTLTKEAIALALSDIRRVRAAHDSYNTPIGAALSILGVRAAQDRMGWIRLLASSKARELAEAEPDTIVLELGASRPGDIDFLAQQVPFRVGVMTAIGSTHLEYFITKEMVAHEYLSLVVSVPQDGTVVLNTDDPFIMDMRSYAKGNQVLYGEASEANVRLVRADRLGMRGFATEISIDGLSYECSLPHLVGRHQIHSALAALAVVKALCFQHNKVERAVIRKAITSLQRLKAPAGRMRLFEGVGNSMIIDDSYSASPEATLAALRTLAAVPARRKIAILGDMLNIGGQSVKWHKEIGKAAIDAADVFIAVGSDMKHAQAVILKEARHKDTHYFQTSQDVGKWMQEHLKEGDAVLVKGSRDMRMEEAVKRLLAYPHRDERQLVQ